MASSRTVPKAVLRWIRAKAMPPNEMRGERVRRNNSKPIPKMAKPITLHRASSA